MHVVLGYIVKINRVVTVDYTNVWPHLAEQNTKGSVLVFLTRPLKLVVVLNFWSGYFGGNAVLDLGAGSPRKGHPVHLVGNRRDSIAWRRGKRESTPPDRGSLASGLILRGPGNQPAAGKDARAAEAGEPERYDGAGFGGTRGERPLAGRCGAAKLPIAPTIGMEAAGPRIGLRGFGAEHDSSA